MHPDALFSSKRASLLDTPPSKRPERIPSSSAPPPLEVARPIFSPSAIASRVRGDVFKGGSSILSGPGLLSRRRGREKSKKLIKIDRHRAGPPPWRSFASPRARPHVLQEQRHLSPRFRTFSPSGPCPILEATLLEGHPRTLSMCLNIRSPPTTLRPTNPGSAFWNAV